MWNEKFIGLLRSNENIYGIIFNSSTLRVSITKRKFQYYYGYVKKLLNCFVFTKHTKCNYTEEHKYKEMKFKSNVYDIYSGNSGDFKEISSVLILKFALTSCAEYYSLYLKIYFSLYISQILLYDNSGKSV